MNIETLYPVRALIAPVNTKAQQAIMRDYAKVAGELLQVEKDFYEQLFEDNDYEYNELYKFYLDRYQKTVTWLERAKKLKTIVINKTYFHDMMYPIEKPLS